MTGYFRQCHNAMRTTKCMSGREARRLEVAQLSTFMYVIFGTIYPFDCCQKYSPWPHQVWGRPPAEDIDAWERLGNPGWNWKRFLEYSKKSET